MTNADVMLLGREALTMTLLISAPILIVAVLVGTIVSLVQAVTQVHEQTLTFLPKLLAVCAVLAVSGGWMLEETVTYAQRSFGRISTVAR